ncbi:MAG: YceI family protein [Bacteroidota bacterium]
MKGLTKLFMLLAIAATFAACSSEPKGDDAKTTDAQEVQKTDAAATFAVSEGTVNWEGTKVGGKHNGTINVTEGSLDVKDGNIVGGQLTIDMNSLICTDLEGEKKANLEGHLKSPDFFEVEAYPTATFQVTNATALSNDSLATHAISGNLTMKDVTKNVTFRAQVNVADGTITATTPPFVINRMDWGVKYGSGSLPDVAKDKAINDNVGLSISLKAAAKTES